MDPPRTPANSNCSTTTASSTSGNNHGSKYQLQHSVNELFQMFNVCEGKRFSRETIADNFEKSIGHQSSKPFSKFYERLVNYEGFVDKYQALKCQNINEVDPFVRILVRIREDKEVYNFLNTFAATAPSETHQQIANRVRLAKSNALRQLEMAASAAASASAAANQETSNNDYRTLPVLSSTANANQNSRKSMAAPHAKLSIQGGGTSTSKHRSSSTSMLASASNVVVPPTIPVIMPNNNNNHHHNNGVLETHFSASKHIAHQTLNSHQHHSQPPYRRSQSSKQIPVSTRDQNLNRDYEIGNDDDDEDYGQISLPPPPGAFANYNPDYDNLDSLTPASQYYSSKQHQQQVRPSRRSQHPVNHRLSLNTSNTANSPATASDFSPLNSSHSTNQLPHLSIHSGPTTIASSSLVSPSLSATGNSPGNVAASAASSANNSKKVPAYLSRDFHPCDWPKENDCFNTLGTVPITDQEQLLLRDLLFVLIGIEGKYIRLQRSNESSRYKLVLDPTADHFLSVTTNRILRISYCYSAIITYVESRVYGLVNQSLVAAIQQHLYDYNMLVCQMEEMLMRNDLFLQKMFFMLLPYFSTFSLLRDCATRLYKNKSVGGAVLTLLHEKTKSIQGMDNNALELCLTLTKSACKPYFEILKTWIYYGEIDDPRREFFIEDTGAGNGNGGGGSGGGGTSAVDGHRHPASADHIESDDEYDDDFGKFNDNYWDLRYRTNQSKMPIFLKKHESIIYKTGKYVSIINKVKQLFIKSSKTPPHLTGIFTSGQIVTTAANGGGGHGSSSLMMGNMLKPSTSTSPQQQLQQQPQSHLWSDPAGLPSQQRLNPLYQVHQPESIMSHHSFVSNSSSSSSACSTTGSGAPAMIFTPKPEDIQYTFDDSTYLSPIMSAYEEASSQLLHILIHESQLVETFNAVKHYLLLSMGDFIVHFMKFASKDLCKRTDSVVQHRLDSMMGMAVGIGVCPSDRLFLKDDPHVEFVGKSFLKQIYQIMKPFATTASGTMGSSFMNDPSPSSSYLFKCDADYDDDDDDDDDEEVGDGGNSEMKSHETLKDINLNRSIISSVIESNQLLDTVDSMNEIRQRKLYINSGKTNKPITTTNSLKDSLDSQESESATLTSQKGQKPPTGTSKTAIAAAAKQKLFCYESLMLKFDVPFPLSLIFTRKSIVCYQLLFRYVFLCRFAEMELEETWKDNILNVELKNNQQLAALVITGSGEQQPVGNEATNQLLVKAFKSIHKKAFALRYKMIAFVRNFHYFYAFEVIDPFFAQFIGQITKRGSSLDSVIECHEKFLEHCFSSCFLTSLEITTIIIKIFTLCIELSHALKDSIDADEQSSMMESSCFFNNANLSADAANPKRYNSGENLSAAATDTDSGSSSTSGGIRKSVSNTQINEKLNKICFSNRHFGRNVRTVKEIIEKANQNFDSLVTKLLKKVYSDNCEYHMMYPFVARLDYNDFYRSKIIEN